MIYTMQNNNIDFEDFINFSMEKASCLFRQSEEYRLLRENVERMEQDLKVNFNADDYSYIEKCFEAMIQLESTESLFLYKQAYKDCVELLKRLEVLK